MSQFTYLHINTVYVGIFLVESIQKNDNYNTNTKNNNNNSSSSSLRKKQDLGGRYELQFTVDMMKEYLSPSALL